MTIRAVAAGLLTLGLTLGLCTTVGGRQAVDVTGGWLMTVDTAMGVASPTVDLKQDGDRVSGVYVSRYGDYPVSGTITGRTIRFSIMMRPDDPVKITYTGEVSADGRRMAGTADLADMGEASWTAERARR